MNPYPSPSRRLLGLLVAAPFILAACSTAGETAEPAPEETAAATEVAATDAMPEATDEAGSGSTAAAFLDIELTDATTGETFTLAGLAGDVVAIEPMAIWCSNCKAQQNNVKEAYPRIADAGVTYISLGIDPGENEGSLARYAERNGYEWAFVKSPTELSRELSDLFGPQILSAPSTPLIVLDANGEVFTQEWGFHDPDSLLDILGEASEASEAA
ncbi:MAG: redoxin family protein [Candidatus Limnocylindrales bacterium]